MGYVATDESPAATKATDLRAAGRLPIDPNRRYANVFCLLGGRMERRLLERHDSRLRRRLSNRLNDGHSKSTTRSESEGQDKSAEP